jgi:CRISPR-associated protein Csm4
LAAMKLFKLAPRTAFHFGQRGVGVEGTQVFCHADTLFSALCLTLRELKPDGNAALTALLEQFPRPGHPTDLPPFRLTSAFPYAGDVLFFPKPSVPGKLKPEASQERGKTLKGVEFVSQGIFTAWLNNEPLDGYLEDENFLHSGDLWVTPNERAALEVFRNEETGKVQLWKSDPVPRVTVDRVTSKSTVYQAGQVRYRCVKLENGELRAGLWVLVDWLASIPPNIGGDEGGASWLTKLLTVLGDSGIGGERSAGYGQFDLEGPTDFAGFGIQGLGKRWLTLATYHPRPDEVGEDGVLGKGCSYKLLIRRGWVASPEGMSFRRPLVRMLGEGSVLHHPKAEERGSYGDLADVTPEVMDPDKGGTGHKVWRYGIAFPVPVGIPVPEKKDEEVAT